MASIRWVATTPLHQTIRLSEDGWTKKIMVSHPEFRSDDRFEHEVRRALEDPEVILQGWTGEFLALRFCQIAPKRPKLICVVYRDGVPEGFVITAFFISHRDKLMRRNVTWRKQP